VRFMQNKILRLGNCVTGSMSWVGFLNFGGVSSEVRISRDFSVEVNDTLFVLIYHD
jgi:hypothetical protein